jgi:hypothetical protein
MIVRLPRINKDGERNLQYLREEHGFLFGKEKHLIGPRVGKWWDELFYNTYRHDKGHEALEEMYPV